MTEVVKTNTGLGHTYYNVMYGDILIERFDKKHEAEELSKALNSKCEVS